MFVQLNLILSLMISHGFAQAPPQNGSVAVKAAAQAKIPVKPAAQAVPPKQEPAPTKIVVPGRIRDIDAKFAQMASGGFENPEEVPGLAARRKIQCAAEPLECTDFSIWTKFACAKAADDFPEFLETWMTPILDGFKAPAEFETLAKHLMIRENLGRSCAKVYLRLMVRRAEKENWQTLLEKVITILTNSDRIGIAEKQEDVAFLLGEFNSFWHPEVFPNPKMRKLLLDVLAAKSISNALLNSVSAYLSNRYLDYGLVYERLVSDTTWFSGDDANSVAILSTFCGAHRLLLKSGPCFKALGPTFSVEKLKGNAAISTERALDVVTSGDPRDQSAILSAIGVPIEYCMAPKVSEPVKAYFLALHFRANGALQKSDKCVQAFKAGFPSDAHRANFFAELEGTRNLRLGGAADLGEKASEALVKRAAARFGLGSYPHVLAEIENLKSLALKKNRGGFAAQKKDLLKSVEPKKVVYFLELVGEIESTLLEGKNNGSPSKIRGEYSKGSDFIEISQLQKMVASRIK